MTTRKKSGLSFFIELVLGISLGFATINYLNIPLQQVINLEKLSNGFCVLIGSIGALFGEQKYSTLKYFGKKLISLAVLSLGAGVALMINIYTRT